MEQLIPVINKLHDAFSLVEGGSPIDLPQIVVVGSQSSGKSSVLENIVGRDFLPRGSGIVTRRPLILQLINIPKSDHFSVPGSRRNTDLQKKEASHADDPLMSSESSDDVEWGEFSHLHQKFQDFNEIREEINRETERITGKNKGISALPINLKVYSSKVVNLTLVDLPGITRVPIGDQPKDIEFQIKKLIYQYISNPNTIILAVTAANTDLTNSDALDIAKEVDPEGRRTLGVITKLDLMDKGTDALDMLTGRIIPLKLGFIGVVNRSQLDINNKKSIQQALKAEREFFSSSPLYRSIGNRCGTAFLAQSLNKLLLNHIRDCLPDLKLRISEMINKRNEELKSYGDPRYESSPGAVLLQIINSFSSNYAEMIEGKLSDDVSTDELYGGARINYIFNEVFAKFLAHFHPLDGLSAIDIRTSISNATGPKASLFVPESAFELLVRKQIARLREPALQCVDLVYDELERILHRIDIQELQRFATLREELFDAATNLIRTCRSPTKEMISNLVNMELAFINTNHPDFQVDRVISAVMQKRAQMQQQQQQQQQSFQQQDSQLSDRNRQSIQLNQKDSGPSSRITLQTQQQQQQQSISNQGRASAKTTTTPILPQQIPNDQETSNTTNDRSGFLSMLFSGNSSSSTTRAASATVSGSGKSSNSISQTSHRNNPSGTTKLQQMPATLSISSIPQSKEFEIELLEGLLECYFGIVRKNIQDAVPKAIMYFLVYKSRQDMQNELVQKLYKEQAFEHLLSESVDIVTKRKTCQEMLDLLLKAQNILNEVRDYSLPSSSSSASSLTSTTLSSASSSSRF